MKIYTVRWSVTKDEKLWNQGIFERAYQDEAKAVKNMKADVADTIAEWKEENPKAEIRVRYEGEDGEDSENPDYACVKTSEGWKEEWFIDELYLKQGV